MIFSPTETELMAQNVNKIQKVDTGLNADSTEWCPYPELQHILLCGTYKLKESQNDSTNVSILYCLEMYSCTSKSYK